MIIPTMNSTPSPRNEDTVNVTAEDLESFKIADIVNLYVPPVILIAGSVLNILSIVVMRTRHFRNISTSIYMIACAANDATSLYISLMPHWLYVNFPSAYTRTSYSHIMCKFFNFWGWGNCDYTIILTAAMTADRAFAIMYPLKASSMDLVRKAKFTVSWLVLVVVAKEFHFLLSSDIVPPTRRDRLCDTPPMNAAYTYFMNKIWPWIHITFLTICFLVILVSNAIIVWNVRRSEEMSDFQHSGGDRERANSEVSGNNSASRGRLRQITTMLLAQSSALIILTYPFSMNLAISVRVDDLYTNPVKKAANQLVFSIVFYLLYSNKCVNFTIYCISGVRFRHALREVITCTKPSRNHSVTRMIKPIIGASQSTISSISNIPGIRNKEVRPLPNG